MEILPPEVLSTIFEFAVPPAGFGTFSERSTDLRTFALTCRSWCTEAQRLLFREPTISRKGDTHDDLHDALEVFDAARNQPAAVHLRLWGLSDHIFLSTKFVTLERLTLVDVLLDHEMLSLLPLLQRLAIRSVWFKRPSTAVPSLLPRLTDLSISFMDEPLPPWILPPELPALKRLAIDEAYYFAEASSDDAIAEPLTFQHILNARDRLDFFQNQAGHHWYDTLDASDISLLADLSLYTLHSFELNDLNGRDYTSVERSLVKHLKIHPRNWLDDGVVHSESKDLWDLEDLKLLVSTYPKLETLILPGHWPQSTLYKEFTEAAKKEKFVVLVEHYSAADILYDNGESRISEVFKEHRRRLRESAVAK